MIRTITTKFNAIYNASAITALMRSKDTDEALKTIDKSNVFDSHFYLDQLDSNSARLTLPDAILHYLEHGAKKKLDPHPLFDTNFYVQTNIDVNFENVNPFVHFLTTGWQEYRNPHPLFDIDYYLDRYKDVRKAKVNPWQHFVLFGAKEGRHPSEYFDAVKYKHAAHASALAQFFRLYLSNKQFSAKKNSSKISLLPYFKHLKKSSLFKAQKGAKLSPSIKPVENPILHFLSRGYNLNLLPFPSFYLLYKLEKGATKYSRVIPNNLLNLHEVSKQFDDYADRLERLDPSGNKLATLRELIFSLSTRNNSTTFMQSKNTILLTSHRANYSGAPMLLLQIIKELVSNGFECLVLLEQGGELEKELRNYAHIINFNYKENRYRQCAEFLSLLFDDLKCSKPKVCILNSLETAPYAKAVFDQQIKIITLVHELVDNYTPSYLHDVFFRSQTVLFPAEFVRNFAHKKIGALTKLPKELIVPNALLENTFNNYDRSESKTLLRQQLAVPSNSLVVLACGSPDLRKGIDYFVTIAKITIAKLKKFQQPVHFVWVGAGDIEAHSAHYYISWDLRQSNLPENIHLLPPQKNLHYIFRGADIFILPSRQDPFPIVVQNAMAAQLPIVAFLNAGGVPEMVSGAGAKLVPYGDVPAFVDAIEQYLYDEELRQADGQLNATTVSERFAFDKYIDKLEAEIKSHAK